MNPSNDLDHLIHLLGAHVALEKSGVEATHIASLETAVSNVCERRRGTFDRPSLLREIDRVLPGLDVASAARIADLACTRFAGGTP